MSGVLSGSGLRFKETILNLEGFCTIGVEGLTVQYGNVGIVTIGLDKLVLEVEAADDAMNI